MWIVCNPLGDKNDKQSLRDSIFAAEAWLAAEPYDVIDENARFGPIVHCDFYRGVNMAISLQFIIASRLFICGLIAEIIFEAEFCLHCIEIVWRRNAFRFDDVTVFVEWKTNFKVNANCINIAHAHVPPNQNVICICDVVKSIYIYIMTFNGLPTYSYNNITHNIITSNVCLIRYIHFNVIN